MVRPVKQMIFFNAKQLTVLRSVYLDTNVQRHTTRNVQRIFDFHQRLFPSDKLEYVYQSSFGSSANPVKHLHLTEDVITLNAQLLRDHGFIHDLKRMTDCVGCFNSMIQFTNLNLHQVQCSRNVRNFPAYLTGVIKKRNLIR